MNARGLTCCTSADVDRTDGQAGGVVTECAGIALFIGGSCTGGVTCPAESIVPSITEDQHRLYEIPRDFFCRYPPTHKHKQDWTMVHNAICDLFITQ